MKKNITVRAGPLGGVFMLFGCLIAGLANAQSASPMVIDRIERDTNAIHFHLSGPPLYDYTVEFADSLTTTNWLPLTNYRAKIAPLDVVVTNSFTNAPARFFRVRQVFCNCRSE